MGRDTAQTERILMRLVNTSSLDSRVRQSRRRVFPRHPCFERVLSCCLCHCCTQNSLFLQSLCIAHGSGAPGFSVLIHGSTTCRQLKSCLRNRSISRMEPCRKDNDKGQRNSWQRPNNLQEAVHYSNNWSHRHAYSGQAEDVHGSATGMDNPGNSRSRRLHVPTHSRMRDVFELAKTEGIGSCGQQ